MIVRLAVLSTLLLAAPALAGGGREAVDIKVRPWSSVGQVNLADNGRCTGALVDRRTVVTAAHCLYNAAARRMLQPQSVHFVLGYQRGAYAFHSVAASIRMDSFYDPASPFLTARADWAVLTLKDEAPEDTLLMEIATDDARPGLAFVSAGFAQDRLYALTKTPTCRLNSEVAGLLYGDCEVPHGYSGGPMIDTRTGKMIGMQIALLNEKGRPQVIGVPPRAWQAP